MNEKICMGIDRIDSTGSTDEEHKFSDEKNENFNTKNEVNDDEEKFINRVDISTELNIPKAIDIILTQLGYTTFHLKLIICCGLIYFSEGVQLFSLNMLMPTINIIFSQESNFWKTFLASALFFGYIIGTIISGFFTKYNGRKNTINNFLIFMSLLSISIGLIENIWFMSFCRFNLGLCMGVICPQYINNLAEFLPSENKEIVIMSMYIFYRCGIIYFTICYKLFAPDSEIILNHWKETFLFSSIPVILVTILSKLFFIDSPKLLLSKKELYKAIDTINVIAENHYNNNLNRFEIEQDNILRLKEEFVRNEIESMEKNQKLNEFSDQMLFSERFNLLIFLCALIFMSESIINVVFIYSLPLMLVRRKIINNNLEDLDMALEILITQIVTIPAILISALVCKIIGRKNTIILGFLFCFIATGIPCITRSGLIVSSALTNFFIIFAQCTIKIYVIEAFPTKIRDYALSFCFCMSKIGDSLTPLLCNLSLNLYSYGPLALCNILSLIGLVASFSLPFDTLGTHIE